MGTCFKEPDHKLRVSGERLSAIPVMTTHGIEDVFVCKGSIDGRVFQQFIYQCVLPIILPFDGNNPPISSRD